MRLRGFVPLDELAAAESLATQPPIRDATSSVPPRVSERRAAPARFLSEDDWETRVSLFGELEG